MVSTGTTALKVLAVTPRLVASTVLTCLVGAVLPPLAGLVLFVGGLTVMALLCAGRLEHLAVRLLYRARLPSPAEAAVLAPALTLLSRQGLGPPRVTIYVRDHPGVADAGLGRRCVLVNSGLVGALELRRLPAEEAAAVIAHAVGCVRLGLTRSDPAIAYWTFPWRLVTAVCSAIAQSISWLPLVHLAWRIRFVVAGVAVVQSFVDGRPGVSVLIAGFIAMTYLGPRWRRAWARRLLKEGDRFVLDHGLGHHMAAYLPRCPPTNLTLERIHHLAGPTLRPSLSMVIASCERR